MAAMTGPGSSPRLFDQVGDPRRHLRVVVDDHRHMIGIVIGGRRLNDPVHQQHRRLGTHPADDADTPPELCLPFMQLPSDAATRRNAR